MPKVKYQTDRKTRLKERREFLHLRKTASNGWNGRQLQAVPARSWLPHAPILETLQDCFGSMQKSMFISNNLQNFCHVCYKDMKQSELKKLCFDHDNEDDFHNLSVKLHTHKEYSGHFPRVHSRTHQKDYHFHYLSKLDDSEFILVCQYCSRHLKRGTSLPKFSIPNYFFPEPVPTSMQSLTVAELLMVSRVFPRCIIYTLSENPSSCHRFLKGILQL